MTKNRALVVLLCIGLASATLTIPLKNQEVTFKENNADVIIDHITFVDSKITKLAGSDHVHAEKLLLDVTTDVNFIISNDTTYSDK